MSARKLRPLRATALATAVLLLAGGVVAVSQVAASAATVPSFTGIQWAYGNYGDQAGTRFVNLNANAPNADNGSYMLQTNLWNRAASGGNNRNAKQGSSPCGQAQFLMKYDPKLPAFQVTNNSANTYWYNPNPSSNPDNSFGDPGCGNGKYDATGHVPCTVGSGPGYDPTDIGCQWAGTGDPWQADVGGSDNFKATTKNPAPWTDEHLTGYRATNPEFSNQIHAPASYPSIVLGCHWSNCSPGDGTPFPMQLNALSSMPVVWDIDTAAVRAAPDHSVFDASLDIWLDSNSRTNHPLPGNPRGIDDMYGQNDGAEVMVWTNNKGYQDGTIHPVGQLQTSYMTIPGAPGHWDLWSGTARSFDNAIRWNVISFVSVEGYDSFHSNSVVNRGPVVNGAQESGIDVKAFLDLASNLGPDCSTAFPYPQPNNEVRCLDPSWWLTSIQAGFEIWSMGFDQTLTTNYFSASPFGFTNWANKVATHIDPVARYNFGTYDGLRPANRHAPVIGQNGGFTMHVSGCPGGSNPSVWLSTNRSDTDNADFAAAQPMYEWPANSGNYYGFPSLVANGVRADGAGAMRFTTTCTDGTQWATSGPVFVSDTADIVFHDTVLGGFPEWQKNQAGDNQSYPGLFGSCYQVVCQPNWKVVGTGDLNHDGRADLLWLNSATKQVKAWLIGVTSPYSVTELFYNYQCYCDPPHTKVVVGDLNGDGIADILWYDNNTGVLTPWYMDGTANGNGIGAPISDMNGHAVLCNGYCASIMTVSGIVDLDDDGDSDIVWDIRGTDQVGGWKLDRFGHYLSNFDLQSSCGCTDPLIGVGDENADGQPDLYRWNSTSGIFTVYQTDGSAKVWNTTTLTGTCGIVDWPCSNRYTPVAIDDFSMQGDPPPSD